MGSKRSIVSYTKRLWRISAQIAHTAKAKGMPRALSGMRRRDKPRRGAARHLIKVRARKRSARDR